MTRQGAGLDRIMRVIEWLNNLKNWHVAVIIAAVGVIVFAPSLANPFWGDDFRQIVNNVPVHSLDNIDVLFSGSTFYDGNGLAPLSGTWYRPLMMTVFSALYALFGANPFWFHLAQVLLHIGVAYLLYLLFRCTVRPLIAITLALLFLVHPINSQAVMAIPSMQEVLLALFGLTALLLLIRFRSVRSLPLVVLALFCAMLAKESAVIFIALAGLCLLLWDRRRVGWYMILMIVPVSLYLFLKIQAVGFIHSGHAAPITALSFVERMMTVPSIMLLYVSKLVAPLHLASSYYWVQPNFSVSRVLAPLLVAAGLIVAIIWGALFVRRRASRTQFMSYIFFVSWLVIGMAPYMQLIPIDMTACEPWVYTALPGLLGAVGIVWQARGPVASKKAQVVIPLVVVLALTAFAGRTFLRSFDWRDSVTVAQRDVVADKDNFVAYDTIAASLTDSGKHREALDYSHKAIALYPTAGNYYNLGVINVRLRDFPAASDAYRHAIKYPGGNTPQVRANISALALVQDNFETDQQFMLEVLASEPNNGAMWLNLAILYAQRSEWRQAQEAIEKAHKYGAGGDEVYRKIMAAEPFVLNINDLGVVLQIPR